MTAYTGPTTHDLLRSQYSPHFTDFGAVVFDARCRLCWYEKAKTEDAKLLEALDMFLATAPGVLHLLHEDWDGTGYSSAGNEAIREVEAAIRQAEN